MGTANTVSVDFSIELQRRALALVKKVMGLCRQDSALADELQAKFYDAVADIESIEIATLPESAGSFVVRAGIMTVSETPVARLLYTVIDDLTGVQSVEGEGVDPLDLMEAVFGNFVLHELRHRTQGIELFGRVAQLKEAGGLLAMAEFDALADRDTAFAYAAATAAGGHRAQFLEAFQEALFLSSAYYFRVFPISAARPDKISRALGVLLMAARLAAIDLSKPFEEDASLPLDAPLVVNLSTDMSRLAIIRGEPHRRLLQIADNDDGLLGDIVGDIDAGRFDSALERCIGLLRRLGIIRT